MRNLWFGTLHSQPADPSPKSDIQQSDTGESSTQAQARSCDIKGNIVRLTENRQIGSQKFDRTQIENYLSHRLEIRFFRLENAFDQLELNEKKIVGSIEIRANQILKDGQVLEKEQRKSIEDKLKKLEEPSKHLIESTSILLESLNLYENTNKKLRKSLRKFLQFVRNG